MSSGSEFALRIALCDLVERLKRSEQKCKYLEQCRNELFKEIIRLKYENETLQRQAITEQSDMSYPPTKSSGISFNHLVNQNQRKSLEIPSTVYSPKRLNQTDNHNDATQLSAMAKCTDESWEEITLRLINELKKEVSSQKMCAASAVEGNIESDLIQNQKSASISSINPFQNNIITQGNSPDKHFVNEAQTKIKQITSTAASTTQVFTERTNNNDFNLDENKILKNYDQNKIVHQENVPFNNILLSDSSLIPMHPEFVDAFSGVICDVKKDLNAISRAIASQNEKLIRLKAKQLRNFFKRQINDDHMHQAFQS